MVKNPMKDNSDFHCPDMKFVIDTILGQNTDHACVEDMDTFESVQIEDDIFMDLYISKQTSSDIRVSHYIDGNASKPDPMVKFDNSTNTFDAVFLDQTMVGIDRDSEAVKRFVENEWSDNLYRQFIE